MLQLGEEGNALQVLALEKVPKSDSLQHMGCSDVHVMTGIVCASFGPGDL